MEYDDTAPSSSRLIGALREAVTLVRMVLYKEVRAMVEHHHPDMAATRCAMLAGAITNEVFGTPNPDPRYMEFGRQNQALIEQELLGLADNLSHLRAPLTDALRIQALCDNQENRPQSGALVTADTIGLLETEREVPLPSSFMTMVRALGEEHQLIVAPKEAPHDEPSSVH
jgi:hypothetical protein